MASVEGQNFVEALYNKYADDVSQESVEFVNIYVPKSAPGKTGILPRVVLLTYITCYVICVDATISW